MGPQGLLKNKIAWPSWHFSRKHFFLLLGIVVPIFVNLAVLHFFVEPLKKKVGDLSAFATLVELKPRMEVLIAESNELMARRIAKGLPARDAGTVLKDIRELAKIQKIEINDLHIQNIEAAKKTAPEKLLEAAGLKKAALSLDITGNYAKIARWLASLDQKMEVRVDNFTLTRAAGENCQLRLELKILLRNS